jgi:hypothetical protein
MSTPNLETILITVLPSGVCLIEFNRPHRGNAFNSTLSNVAPQLPASGSLILGMERRTEMGYCESRCENHRTNWTGQVLLYRFSYPLEMYIDSRNGHFSRFDGRTARG